MRKGRKRILISVIVLILVIAGYSTFSLLRTQNITDPPVSASQLLTKPTISEVSWPTAGSSAVGLLGSNSIETHGPQLSRPTASVAKLITALVVLKAKPLQVGQQGPLISLSPSDVAIYDKYVAEQGSVVPVAAGEVISEYQMLEGMLLPSANNMADSLAIWAYGSLPAYSQAANSFLVSQGLTATHVGVDASGYDPSTTASAYDLVQLGELALQNPVIAQIVSLPSVTGIPLTTTVENVNSLLDTNGVIGIKTGNTTQAGGVFVSASNTVVNHKTVTVVTSLAGTPTLAAALKASIPFIQSTHTNFQTENLIKAGDVVASYSLPWGGSVPVVAHTNFSASVWNDSPASLSIQLQTISDKLSTNDSVGTLSVWQEPSLDKHTVSLYLARRISPPSAWWRLTHPTIGITL